MTVPNFLVIGAQKSGTSSLHDYLDRHPQIFMSPIKEPKYLALDGAPPDFAGPYPSASPMVTTRAEYEALFDGAGTERAIGESSTWYLHGDGVPERIARELGEVRLVAVLRDPVSRAFSNFLNNRRNGMEPLARFEDAVRAEPERRARGWGHPWDYLEKGRYAKHLSRFYERFGRERIGVFLYDDLARDPGSVLAAIFRFLELDEAPALDASQRRNEGPAGPAERWLRRVAPGLWRRSRGLPPRLATRLGEAFAADVRDLEDLLGRDLSSWRPPREARR